MKRIYIYGRVSTKQQADKELPIDGQLSSIREFADKNDMLVEEEYVDRGESAKTADRPAFQRMIEDARSNHERIDAVVVWNASRFARNLADAILYKGILRENGIEVISITERFDPETISGYMLENILDLFSDVQGKKIGVDTRRGMRECASKGFFPGGVAPIGYKKKKVECGTSKRNLLVPDDEFAPVVKGIFRKCDGGMGLKAIVNALNQEGVKTNKGKSWRTSYIHTILTRETYMGDIVWNKHIHVNGKKVKNDEDDVIRVKDAHKPIVSRELFERVQKKLRSRSPKQLHPRLVNSNYLLTGIIYCGKCGAAMLGSPAKSGKYHYYCCGGRLKKGNTVCQADYIPQEKLEDSVFTGIQEVILDEKNLSTIVRFTKDSLKKAMGEYDEHLGTIEEQIKDVDRRLGRLYEVLETGSLDLGDLAQRIREHKQRKGTLESTKAALMVGKDTEFRELDRRTVVSYAKKLRSLLKNSTQVERKGLIRALVKRIDVNLPKITIEYRIPCKQLVGTGGGVLAFIQPGEPANQARSRGLALLLTPLRTQFINR